MTARRPRRPAALLLALLLAFIPGLRAAPVLEFDQGGLDPPAHDAADALALEALSLLPPAWILSLGPTVRVRWDQDLPQAVHGRTTSRGVRLQRRLLDDWMARPAGDGDPPHPALVALLHELAHVHDRSPAGGLSRDPRLLDLAGWQIRPFRVLPRLKENAFTDRSPDRYELHDPAEFVAVNLEHWLLDPEYACRRPALAHYFELHFQHRAPRAECAPGLPFLDPGADTGDALLELDPARIYQVDYLLAEGNERVMSRWGHSMLRLVVCAPGRQPGPDCRLDLDHHRVLSFRAFVGDVQISSWGGLTGTYPSRLFVLPLDQVVEEYTRVELRALVSLPLRLSRDEITGLLQRAARVHWGYDGNYRFISNNCAVETFKLLHDGVPRLADAGLSSITPTGLLRRLRRQAVLEADVPAEGPEAIRLGYRFEPMDAHYESLYETAREVLDLPFAGAKAWLALPAAERTGWLHHADLRAAAALLVLEQAALRRQELLARDELKRRFLDTSHPDGLDGLVEVRALLEREGALTRPAMLLQGAGYGVPQQDERQQLRLAATARVERIRQDAGRLHEMARQWLSPQRRAALEGGEANLQVLGERLRALHREAGGLVL